MSTPSSPPPGAAYVPYLPYKSKRHSRNLSNTNNNSHYTPNQSPPPVAKSNNANNSLVPPQQAGPDGGHDAPRDDDAMTALHFVDRSAPVSVIVAPPPESPNLSSTAPFTPDSTDETSVPAEMPLSPVRQTAVTLQVPPRSSFLAVPSASSSSTLLTPKKVSTFRKLPAKNTRLLQAAGHGRNVSTTSLPHSLSETPTATSLREGQSPLTDSPAFTDRAEIAPQSIQQTTSHSSNASNTSIAHTLSTHPPSGLSSPVSASSSKPAPYRPGFQPKGVYRPLTDEFIARRGTIRDSEDQGGITRVERTKLERRLEKLIALHFSRPEDRYQDFDKSTSHRPHSFTRENRRASSFFDFQAIRGMNIQDAGDLWRGVVKGGLGDTTKMDIRAAEQRITPWQDDAEVSSCPLCLATFHPLTNRKHHCRLCGQIICSLPIKHPQRPVTCSVLFVVDIHTKEIEEVGEGVDYGVKKRRVANTGSQHSRQEDEDKFLKGVRICRQCRPILLQQQYFQQVRTVPPFVQMYENFIRLEAEIEESLPKFQDLLMTLTHHDQPTKEASAARKRLLASFAQYDKLSKEIRALPCPNGAGSSQDRVQTAITTRANLFLQKNMFPLQSLPTPKTSGRSPSTTSHTNGMSQSLTPVDPDSALAHALQPLLEQETLIESFVEEAQAQRKFEDVKTLKVNLQEIRGEIERIIRENKL